MPGGAGRVVIRSSVVTNRPLLVLVLLWAGSAFALPFLKHAPNRLLSGQPLWLAELPMSATGSPLFWLAIPIIALMAGPFVVQKRLVLALLMLAAATLLVGLVALAGQQATALAARSGPLARTSMGSGFWLMLITAGFMIVDLAQRSHVGTAGRAAIWLGVLLAVSVLFGSGHLDDLSIMKEYAAKADQFREAVLRHVLIVVGALVPTLVLGVPLGVVAFLRPRQGRRVLGGLNMIQTIPSIALFALLMGPLSALAVALPWLRSFGISGIGLTPAIIALTLYCMLPIVRNTHAGLSQVPGATVDAARGMGMTSRQVFWQVEVPLALPVFLAGLRTTMIQAIGLAAIAALIGAGGLGSIMFQGLFSNALDLVLLGTLPIIAMVLMVDAAFAFLVKPATGRAP